jgi:cation transport regulator ChaC
MTRRALYISHWTTEGTEAVEGLVRGVLDGMRREGVDLDEPDAVAEFGREYLQHERDHGAVNAEGLNLMVGRCRLNPG